jgi:hypothetical protein
MFIPGLFSIHQPETFCTSLLRRAMRVTLFRAISEAWNEFLQAGAR